MRHFIGYHNPEKMKYQYSVGPTGEDTFFTNRPVKHVVGNRVWVVTFEKDHEYSLASVFRVSRCGDANESGFKHYVAAKDIFSSLGKTLEQRIGSQLF